MKTLPPLFIDFETRSEIDLPKRGVYNYASHPSTDLICMSYAIGGDYMGLWWPWHEPFPRDAMRHIKRGGIVAAWNAAFERLHWNGVGAREYGLPVLPIEQFLCIAALSRARGFPGKLEKAAKFAGLPVLKDMDGHRLMMKMCRPKDDGTWNEEPDDLERLGEYCVQDSEVERALFDIYLPFSEDELAAYHRCERLNDTGIHYHHALAAKIVEDVVKEKFDAAEDLSRLTNGLVETPNQVAKIRAWLDAEGYPLPDLNKGTVLDVLDNPELPDNVRGVLEIRQEQAKAAVSKFEAMINRGNGEIIQGLYMFRGAGQTGRYSSSGVQIHNLVRKSSPEAIPVFMKRGITGLRMMGNPMTFLSQMVRPAFVAAPGKTFLVGDFAQIEARIAAWLAGEEWVLEAFRDGRDLYCEFGTDAFGRPITKADELERAASKACMLGLQFGGAEGALRRSLKSNSNIELPAEIETHLVKVYRDRCKKIKKYWYVLQDAVLAAMFSPGSVVEIQGNISYMFDGEHLWCRLPSGRLMCYPFAEVVDGEWGAPVVRYRRGNRSPKSGALEWPTVDLWYGILIENLAQGIALDLLDNALANIEKHLREVLIRGHVHDEIIGEVLLLLAEQYLPVFLKSMEAAPEWAAGLPVKAEGHFTDRYVKG